jgi:FAD/FMN-containing dehydrogenase
MEKDILDNQYYTDPATETRKFFASKGVSMEQLEEWQAQHPVIYPWDTEYNTLRQAYNRRRQYYPIAIVMAKRVTDIRWAFILARKLDVPFAVRSAGHDWNGLSLSAGIVIDISRRDYVRVEGETVAVGAGIHVGPLAKALENYGLVIPSGTCQNVGLAGLSLGAGLGMLTRHYGLTIDALVAVRLLLADGSLVIASGDNEYADLFWALRGAGAGNLGIVTDLVFKAYKLTHVYLFQVWIKGSGFRKLFKWWQQWAPTTDLKLTTKLNLFSKADVDERTPEQVLLSGEYSGEKNHLVELLQPAIDMSVSYRVWRVTYTDAMRYFAYPDPNYFFQIRGAFVNKVINDDGAAIIESYLATSSSGMGFEMRSLGGVFSRVSATDTAFPWRDALFWLQVNGGWRNPLLEEKQTRWVNGAYNELRPYYESKGGVPMLYYNFADLSLEKGYALAYWSTNTKRLIEVKTKYDPGNVFSRPQGIPLK